jgi:hypothetical protein
MTSLAYERTLSPPGEGRVRFCERLDSHRTSGGTLTPTLSRRERGMVVPVPATFTRLPWKGETVSLAEWTCRLTIGSANWLPTVSLVNDIIAKN